MSTMWVSGNELRLGGIDLSHSELPHQPLQYFINLWEMSREKEEREKKGASKPRRFPAVGATLATAPSP